MFRAVHQLEAAGWLLRTLASGVPFAAFTGEAGVGKTVVMALAANRLNEAGIQIIRVEPPFAGPLELQALLAEALGLAAGTPTTPALVATALRERRPSSGAVVLLVDGAEQIPPTLLQYLWLMHRLSGLGGPRLQIVFAGRFAFWGRFVDAELNDLRSEIAARFVVLPLPPAEASAYVRHRLSEMSADVPTPISGRRLRQVVREGQGIPARLNAAVDALTQRQPIQLVAVRAAAAVVPTPPWWRGRAVAVSIGTASVGVAAAVVAGSVFLSTSTKPALRTAALLPPPVVVAPPTPTPTPPAPPPPKLVTMPAPPPNPPLPVAAMLRIALQYPAADPGAAARATTVAGQLRGRGFLVDEPVAATGATRGTSVEYYFAEDREQAEQLARDLAGSVSLGQLGGSREPPPPGTIRIMLANAAVTLARSP